jgi:cytochrome c oxidase subunit 1
LFGQDKQRWALVLKIIFISLLSSSSGQTVGQFPTIAKPCSLAAIKFGHTLVMKQKPYNLLLWTGLVFVLTSFFILRQNNSVDIHLHDTYFVIAHTHIFWLLAILALFVWTLYLLTNKILYSKALTWAHVIITILTLLLFALTLFFGDSFMNPTPRRYYDYTNWNSFDNYTTFTKAIGISIFVLLFGQFIFVINLILGLFKRLTNRKT